jgi:putative endonuclease
LAARGLAILGRNVRTPDGEVDLIACDQGVIVFVEVKARRGRSHGSAIGAIDRRKRARLRAVAADYLQYMAPAARARFDVVTVEGTEATWYKDAF